MSMLSVLMMVGENLALLRSDLRNMGIYSLLKWNVDRKYNMKEDCMAVM